MKLYKYVKDIIKSGPTLTEQIDMSRYKEKYPFAVYDVVESLWQLMCFYDNKGQTKLATFINDLRIEIALKYLPGYISEKD